jgi:hypothetical protein
MSAPSVYTIQLAGTTDKLDSFVAAIPEADILEVVRSGVAGIARGEKVLSALSRRGGRWQSSVDSCFAGTRAGTQPVLPRLPAVLRFSEDALHGRHVTAQGLADDFFDRDAQRMASLTRISS